MGRAVRDEERRYRRFGRAHMLWFRTSSIVEILLSVSFPFVIAILPQVSPDMNGVSDLVITGISVGIALVGAVSGFYGWHDNWRLYRTQQLALTIVIREWELQLLELVNDAEANATKAHTVTKEAIDKLTTTLQHEHDLFFGSVQLPAELLPKQGQQV